MACLPWVLDWSFMGTKTDIYPSPKSVWRAGGAQAHVQFRSADDLSILCVKGLLLGRVSSATEPLPVSEITGGLEYDTNIREIVALLATALRKLAVSHGRQVAISVFESVLGASNGEIPSSYKRLQDHLLEGGLNATMGPQAWGILDLLAYKLSLRDNLSDISGVETHEVSEKSLLLDTKDPLASVMLALPAHGPTLFAFCLSGIRLPLFKIPPGRLEPGSQSLNAFRTA